MEIHELSENTRKNTPQSLTFLPTFSQFLIAFIEMNIQSSTTKLSVRMHF